MAVSFSITFCACLGLKDLDVLSLVLHLDVHVHSVYRISGKLSSITEEYYSSCDIDTYKGIKSSQLALFYYLVTFYKVVPWLTLLVQLYWKAFSLLTNIIKLLQRY